MPDWIEKDMDEVGYSIKLSSEKTETQFLQKNFDKNDGSAVLIDDTRKTGSALEKIKKY